MDANQFQQKALLTDTYRHDDKRILLHALEMLSECGEAANKIKKLWRDGDGTYNEAERLNVLYELGDVLWGIAVLSKDFDATLGEVMALNNDKLLSRFNKGTLGGSGDER